MTHILHSLWKIPCSWCCVGTPTQCWLWTTHRPHGLRWAAVQRWTNTHVMCPYMLKPFFFGNGEWCVTYFSVCGSRDWEAVQIGLLPDFGVERHIDMEECVGPHLNRSRTHRLCAHTCCNYIFCEWQLMCCMLLVLWKQELRSLPARTPSKFCLCVTSLTPRCIEGSNPASHQARRHHCGPTVTACRTFAAHGVLANNAHAAAV